MFIRIAPRTMSSTYWGLRCTVTSTGKMSPVPDGKYLWNRPMFFRWSISSSGSSPIGMRVPGLVPWSESMPTCACSRKCPPVASQ